MVREGQHSLARDIIAPYNRRMKLTEIFPAIPQVRNLLVCTPEMTEDDPDFWIWVRSFQGLINKVKPELYLMRPSPWEREGQLYPFCEDHWLDYYRKTFSLPVSEENDLNTLIEQFRDRVDGYVVYDNREIIQTQNLAITMAGLDRVLPVAPSQEQWMVGHGIPKRDDLRGRFASDDDAAEWAVDNLWPRCYKRLYANFCVHRPYWYAMNHALEDFVVYHQGMALDLPRSRRTRRSLLLFRRMMEQAEAPGVQMNWHCITDQEKEYVAEAAKYGFFSLCSISSPNLTIHGGVGDTDASYSQPMPEARPADANKTYVTFYNSDGDATWALNNVQSGNWEVPQRGEFKFNWGFLPLAVRLQPAMLQYFHETRTANDCFWGPSSGAGYTYSFLWPEDQVDNYLAETRRLLDQSGQRGCNMVNWHLQDWWREVEDEEAVLREQTILGDGPGLVMGLGGSPYARSYLSGPIPKVHSMHIANVGQDNFGDIRRFLRECPTRPGFLFLFAQISVGIWEQLASEMDKFDGASDIEVVTMDEFFLLLKDAIDRDLVGDELYEKTDALAETWLKAPGRHRVPLCERLADELARVASAGETERRRSLAHGGWSDLVSKEVESVATDRGEFLELFKDLPPVSESEEADTLLYVGFTVTWTLIRSVLEAQGIYANQRNQCLTDFVHTCGGIVDVTPFQAVFDAWEHWEEGVPSVEAMAKWFGQIGKEAAKLRAAFGADDAEEFSGWPPPTI